MPFPREGPSYMPAVALRKASLHHGLGVVVKKVEFRPDSIRWNVSTA